MSEHLLFEDYLDEQLADRESAQLYLDLAFEEYGQDGDAAAFLLALRDVVRAQGGMTKLSREADLNRANLYAALSENGNPRFETIMAILKTLGMRLSVKEIEKREVSEPAKAEAG
jgi:probable addiction module antidote protein